MQSPVWHGRAVAITSHSQEKDPKAGMGRHWAT